MEMLHERRSGLQERECRGGRKLLEAQRTEVEKKVLNMHEWVLIDPVSRKDELLQ